MCNAFSSSGPFVVIPEANLLFGFCLPRADRHSRFLRYAPG